MVNAFKDIWEIVETYDVSFRKAAYMSSVKKTCRSYEIKRLVLNKK